jgi:hypothetical protein
LPDASITPTDFKVGLKIADGTVKLSGSSTLFGEAWETEMTAAIANVELQVFHA